MCLYLRSSLPLGWQLRRREEQEVFLRLYLVLILTSFNDAVPCNQADQRRHLESVRLCLCLLGHPIYAVRVEFDHLSHLPPDKEYDYLGVTILEQD